MRSYTITSTFSLLVTSAAALQIPSIFADFYEPHLDDTPPLSSNSSSNSLSSDPRGLFRRDGNCPLNYNSCVNLAVANAAAACCTIGASCTTDRARNIACCPIGATCTGTLGRTVAPTPTAAGGIVFGTTTPAAFTTTPLIPVVAAPASVVNNVFFPFPYIPTTYVNSAACNTAFNACQSNYAACTQNLQAGGFAVTVVAPNGGVTVAPTAAQNVGLASATSICSSLSQEACYGIVSDNCAQFGQGTETGFVVATVTRNEAPRRTGMGCVGVMAGLGLGIARQMI